jgi:hypothetical protein
MKPLPIILCLLLFVCRTVAQQETSSVTLESNISLIGIIEPFQINNHTFDTCDTGLGWKSICLIDHAIWFGCDAGMELPKYQLVKLSIKIENKVIGLDVLGMFNPNFTNKLKKEQFKLEKAEVGYLLNGWFSDGAGGYTAQWKIIKGKSFRTKITNDEHDFHWQFQN